MEEEEKTAVTQRSKHSFTEGHGEKRMFAWFKKYHVLNKLLALAAAVLFWFVVMSIINPDIEISFSDVKVTINGKTELYNRMEYSILSDTDMTMDVTLRGKRNVVLRLKKSDIELICDVSQISGDGENRIMCSVNTPDGDITVVNRTELIATVLVDKIIDKELNILTETTGELEENLRPGAIELSQQTVTVRGPTIELAGISHAVVTLPLDGVTSSATVQAPILLVNDAGETVELVYSQLLTKTVDAYLPIQMIKEIPLKITLNSGGGLTDQEVDTVITPSKITVIGERAAVEEIESLSLGMIDLEGIGDGITAEKEFVLPSGISCMNDRVSATVMVTVKDIVVKPFTLTDIQLLGANDHYDVELIDQTISVRLRGNATLLDTISESDFTAVVYVQELDIDSEGMMFAPVKITFKPAVNAALVESEYSVTVNVTRKHAE